MKVAGDLTASEAAVMQVLANDPDIQKILDEALKHDRDRNK